MNDAGGKILSLLPMTSSHVSPLMLGMLGSVALASFWYVRSRRPPGEDKPKLYHQMSALNEYVIKHCKRLTSPYVPPFWATNGHVQTILGTKIKRDHVEFARELVTLSDGGTVALDWTGSGDDVSVTSPIVMVLPGLTGDSQGISHVCQYAVSKGYRVLVMLKRGHGGVPLTTPKMQSFGDPHDLREVVLILRERYPDSRIACIGFSAGSGLLVSYLGEFGKDTRLDVGVCVSPGYDAEELFVKGVLGQPYDYLMMNNLKALVKPHTEILSKVLDMKAVMASRTIAEFDSHFYCKIYGFPSLSAYWAENNPMRACANISVPIMCLSSLDDPVCRAELISYHLFDTHPMCLLATTERGGHCGFLERDLKPWSDRTAIAYIDTVIEYLNISSTD